MHYTYDTYASLQRHRQGGDQQGGKTWFFLTADYAFGHALEKDATAVMTANGGKVLGSVAHPFPGSDFSSFLLQAQASGAQVIGLANAGADTTNAIKQAAEFGITPKQSLAGLLMFITDVHSLGLKPTQGMYLTTGFYWDRNDETRAWSSASSTSRNACRPWCRPASIRRSITTCEAVKATGTDEAMKVMAAMKKAPINDFFAKNGVIRADGRMVLTCTWYRSRSRRTPVPVGLLHHPPDHPGRPGLPAAVRVALPAGQEISLPSALHARGGEAAPGVEYLMEIFGIPSALLGSQLLIGLINGSFYAILSLGLAIIFGLLNIINFAHGAQYMMGAFIAWIALTKFGINYWVALIATRHRRASACCSSAPCCASSTSSTTSTACC